MKGVRKLAKDAGLERRLFSLNSIAKLYTMCTLPPDEPELRSPRSQRLESEGVLTVIAPHFEPSLA